MKSNPFYNFSLILLSVLGLSFISHAWIQHALDVGFYSKLLPINYLFNLVVTLVFFWLLLRAKKKNQNHLGVIFLYSSLIKFLLFFLFIYPNLGEFNGVKSAEFASFFIPYALSLSLEIYFLSKLLNS
jgi:hypothetical protein